MRVVDAHFHMWDPRLLDYDWLEGDLDRPYGPEQALRADMGTALQRIFVQADCRPEQSLREVRWVAATAAQTSVVAVVAHAALERGARAVSNVLAEYARDPFVVGVRRLLQSEPIGFAASRHFRESARLLSEHGLTFDACVLPHQIADITKLADAVPQLNIVLDHLGKPTVMGGPVDEWYTDLFELAQRPSVSVKLSGLPAQVRGEWAADQMAPYFDACLSAFGSHRLMFGSDWPVSQPAARWENTVSGWAQSRLGYQGAQQVMGANALRTYGLG